MKSALKASGILLATVISMTACNNSSTDSTTKSDSSATTTSTPMAPMPADTAKPAMAAMNPDQDAINFAVPKNMKEIAWLKAGMSKGGPAVKEHAKMMLADHVKLDGEVSAMISKKGWATPSVDTANEVTINDKTGKDFDKAWTDKMVADHKEVIDSFNKAKMNVKDADLKALITKTLPVLQKHLDMAQAMEGKMK